MISVLIADSQRLLAETLSISLQREPGIKVIDDHPAGGRAAINAVLHHRPDVSLIDFWLAGMEGPAVVRSIVSKAPELRILLLSWFASPQQVQRGLGAGALAFLPKTVVVEDVVEAVNKAHLLKSPALSWVNGKPRTTGSTEAPKSIPELLDALTPREIDILSRLRSLGGVEPVAQEMAISPGTVRNHVQSILKKLKVHSQLEAIALARRHGVIS